MSHSLEAAVADGTISESAAFLGLSPDDVENLSIKHPDVLLLVRFRSADADGRGEMTARELVYWSRGLGGKRREFDCGYGRLTDSWSYDDIRDVQPVFVGSGS